MVWDLSGNDEYTQVVFHKMPLDHLAWLSTTFEVKCHPETFRSVPCVLPKVVIWQEL